MRKLLSVFALLICTPISVIAESKLYEIGNTDFEFYSSENIEGEPIWDNLFMIKSGEKIKLFDGMKTYFYLPDSDSFSLEKKYMMIPQVIYGDLEYNSDDFQYVDKQYCTFIKTSNGCVIYSTDSYKVCDGEWSKNNSDIWIFNNMGRVSNLDFSSPLKEDEKDYLLQIGGSKNLEMCK